MGATFVEVPAADIEGFLAGKGFARTVVGCEVVYVRKSSRNPDVVIKVYTSVRVGNASVRRVGRDAIRVCVVFENGRKSFGIGRFPHVNRVGSVQSVLARVQERLLDAAARGNEWIDQQSVRDAQYRRGALRDVPADLPGAAPVSLSRLSPPVRERAPYGDPAFEERVKEKAEIARREQEAEERGFLSDPDYRDFAAGRPGGVEPPPGTFASVARMLASCGIMSGEEADEWKDRMKDGFYDEPGHVQHAGEP